jgi:hypothetical protein
MDTSCIYPRDHIFLVDLSYKDDSHAYHVSSIKHNIFFYRSNIVYKHFPLVHSISSLGLFEDETTLYRNLDNRSIRRPWWRYDFLQIKFTGRGTPGISAACVASHGLTSVFEHVLVSMRWADHHWDVRPCLLDALKSSWRSGIMVFLLTAWKTSSASNPGCLSRRYGKLTLSKVLHFHFQNLSSPRAKLLARSLHNLQPLRPLGQWWYLQSLSCIVRGEMAFVAQKTGIYTLSAQALHLNLDHSERELRAYELTRASKWRHQARVSSRGRVQVPSSISKTVDTYHEAKYTLDNLQDGFAQGKAGLADEWCDNCGMIDA